MAVNQILSDGKFSWTWLYASLGVSVLFLLYSEAFATPDAANAPQTVRGGRKVYLRQLRASVQDMETVGVATPGQFVLRMRQVYVDVSLVPQALHTTTGEPFLGAVPVAEPAPGPGERRSLESVLRDAERETVARVLAVVGGPGSGKTTLARNTALSLCRRHWALRRPGLPVLIYLRDHAAAILAEDAPALGEVAVSVGWLEGKVSATWMERQLDRGGCVVLLDGLDEVADTADRGRVVSWTRRQIQRHPHNTYVVTSRPHGYESNPLPGAEVLQVRRFTAEQVSRFMHQWSHATERRAREGSEQDVRAVAHRNAENLLARLREKPALYDLAANPLLLTMTANVHRYRGQLPGSRAELYAEMCDVLLHRRSEDRGLHDATGLGGPHKQHVVQHLALAMMKARTRDWPLHHAVEAIRYPLQQVPGNVRPEVFLEEARKSGLLVEREHGVYGFAHLTLQEYLAAAQLGTPLADTSLLTENVNDTWWRETILLWTAGNDATDIINACLQLDTVTTLALAFDCAEQARTVHPDTRSRLEALLESAATGQDHNPQRRRLLNGVQAVRILRETIPVSDSAALCARPIPHTLYDLFVQNERAEGRRHPHRPDFRPPGESDPATGMHAQDAERFITWLNNITGDNIYRLPTPAEVSDHYTAADLTQHAIWTHDGTRAILHQPPGVPWPYTLAPSRNDSTSVADRKQIEACLWLMLTTSEQRKQVEKRAGALAAALSHLDSDQANAPLELALALSLAFQHALAHLCDLDRDYDYDAASALGAALRQMARDPDGRRATAYLRARERASQLAQALVAHDEPVVPHAGLEFAMGRALYLSRALHFDLHRDLDRYLVDTSTLSSARYVATTDRYIAQAFALTLARSLARALDRAGEFDITRALDQALDSTTDRDLRDTVLSSLHIEARNSVVNSLDSELSRDDVDSIVNIDNGRVTIDENETRLILNIERSLAIALGAHNGAHRIAMPALMILLKFAINSARVGTSYLEALDNALKRLEERSLTIQMRSPEDPIETLRAVANTLTTTLHGTLRFADPVLRLVDQTLDILTALRDRRISDDRQVLACIRTALLAVAAALLESGQHSETVGLLLLAWRNLATHGQGPSNQALLVVRTSQ
ncbi:NACHT domain-containing protein [Streptomyces mirabilis]|uniref:NACHT domain-containing protein n=1 Tax=Streptomyces mirabilis TaxID=68239 RepID=UPI002259F012|nr:NACHT domain-containing protein [Streptomyces mirabilis]MCX4430247.1 NACHT domain-containing protein [Streptomyces mirabilis]